MAQQNRATLKGFFETGDVPTEAQFIDLIDSFHSIADSGAAATVTGTETLTNKTLTAPVLSGTITGTYTLAGTPTLPSTVVTLAGVQTLTSKTLASPTISSGAILNGTIVGTYTLAGSPTFPANVVLDADVGVQVQAFRTALLTSPASNPVGVAGADAVFNIISLTQAEYNAIAPVAGTFYIVTP